MVSKKSKARAEPKKKRKKEAGTLAWLCSQEAYDILTCSGYKRLADSPEIIAGVDTIAKLVGSMTIHLMKNGEKGDSRIRNEFSRKIDIDPNKNMTRSSFVQWIVRTMYLEGDGNAVVFPEFKEGYLYDLKPIPAGIMSLIPKSIWDYEVNIAGQTYDPDQVIHFMLSPGSYYPWKGEGLKVPLKEVTENLKQASATEKGFMQSKWKPSVIVKVDSGSEEFASKDGRKKILQDYIETTDVGEPWVIPAEDFEVQVVKPLSLSDLAIADMVELDKKTVASILRVPPFVLGIGTFKRDEWNNFINSTIMTLAKMIEQELTKKLLYSPDFYFRFNARSLYNYELKDLAAIADDQYIRGIMDGNEVRDWLGLSPRDGLDELVILENYIPVGMIGDQKKLVKDGGE